MEDILTKFESPKLFEMFVSADSRNFFLDLVYHHCAFGPGDNYDSCQRCYRWLCEYLLLSISEANGFETTPYIVAYYYLILAVHIESLIGMTANLWV